MFNEMLVAADDIGWGYYKLLSTHTSSGKLTSFRKDKAEEFITRFPQLPKQELRGYLTSMFDDLDVVAKDV